MTRLIENNEICNSNNCFACNTKSGSHQKTIKPRLEADPNLIVAARRYWMMKTGMSAEEIEEHCNLDEYPGTLEDELEEIAALKVVEELNRRIKWNV